VLDINGKIEVDDNVPTDHKSFLRRSFNVVIGILKVAFIVPLWFIAFFVNATYQGIASSTRQRSFKRLRHHVIDLEDFETGEPRGLDTLLHDEGVDVVETVYSMVGSEPERKLHFSPTQAAIAARLNGLQWNKFPVRITLSSHSHAAAIVRFKNPLFVEGETVVRHWLDSHFPEES
jgi:hypothetical protein